MHRYFEMFETERNLGTPSTYQDIRIEITEDSEAAALIAEYREYFGDVSWKAQIHHCNHDIGESCNIIILESD